MVPAWYMLRLLVGPFLSAPGARSTDAREAPALLLISQLLLIGGIMLLSLCPKPLMGSVSNAITRLFAATLVWQRQSLETIYGLGKRCSRWPRPSRLRAFGLSRHGSLDRRGGLKRL